MTVQPIQAGKLRNLLEFQQNYRDKRTRANQPIDNWQTYFKCKGYIRPLSATERDQSTQIEALLTHQIQIRYPGRSVDIQHEHRVKFGRRTFQILGILNIDERNRVLQIEVREEAC